MQQTLSTLIFFWFKNLIQCLITSIVAVLSLEILSGRINGHSAPVDLAIFEIINKEKNSIKGKFFLQDNTHINYLTIKNFNYNSKIFQRTSFGIKLFNKLKKLLK